MPRMLGKSSQTSGRRHPGYRNTITLTDKSAPGLAIEICGLAVELPYLAQRELLGVIGSKSWQALEIVRWVGMGLLVPGCLEDLSPVSYRAAAVDF